MRNLLFVLVYFIFSLKSNATVHTILVWDGYFQFVDSDSFSSDITIELGDTVQWLPLDPPTMMHTITSTNIPTGAMSFDYIWQAPADTFFQYIPEYVGLYEYECTPHVQFNMVGTINVVQSTNSTSSNSSQPLFLYPNPSDNFIRIDGLENEAYQLVDISGRIWKKGHFAKELNITKLPKGKYQLFLCRNRQSFTFVKE